MAYEHLRFSRETPLIERHRRRGFPSSLIPENPQTFGAGLRQSFEKAKQPAPDAVAGYDDRILFKLQLCDGAALPELSKIPGVELVSQEDKSVVLAFANAQGLAEFEGRLTSLARYGTATRKELLFALQGFDHWTAEDRKGNALKQQGFPEGETFVLDVELWPLQRADQRQALFGAFLAKLQGWGVECLDKLNQPSLVMVRVRCSALQAQNILLEHRDVRMVDLPPRTGISVQILMTDINTFPPPPQPPENAPAIAVLDTGLTAGHPVLANSVGDAQGYLQPLRQVVDSQPWHGTFVSGLALYGDVHANLENGRFIPQLRLYSGKVFEDGHDNQVTFVERAVEESVRDLHSQYGCKVFNLSYGDSNKVYDGRHVRGLAYTLDRLARELDVLFVVPTGNLSVDSLPADPRSNYPGYLLEDYARLLDPATALNVLTVGGLTRYISTHAAQRNPHSIEDMPIAQAADMPFPLGRSGLSICGAIKPDLVEHAGNLALMRAGGHAHTGLGIVSTSGRFSNGHPFAEDIGTSYAAPQVAHRAARLLSEVPDASANLLRSLLGVHARWPQASIELLTVSDKTESKRRLLRLLGYGQVDDNALYRSLDQSVTLLSEDRISNDKCHFYELPLPDSFWSRGTRQREITVALAYSPDVRTTRLDYRMSKLWFTLVGADSLDEVEAAFKQNREEGMGEIDGQKRWLSNNDRKAGTLQVSRWTFKKPLYEKKKIFVVVTRQDASWGTVSDDDEPYALTVLLADRVNVQVNLYAQVSAVLQARAQARARARV